MAVGINKEEREQPNYFNWLSPEDQKMYIELQNIVGSNENRYNRNRRLVKTKESFDSIRKYCEHDKDDAWKRYLVCGICWHDDYIAINTKQLKHLISKCKSSINDVLAKMGYETLLKKDNDTTFLIKKIPYLGENTKEYRQWTIRKLKCIRAISTDARETENELHVDFRFSDSSDSDQDPFELFNMITNEYEFWPPDNVFVIIPERFPNIRRSDILHALKGIKDNRRRDELINRFNNEQ